MRLLIAAGVAVLLAVALTLPRPEGGRLFGFSRASARAHLELEQRFLAFPDTAVIRDTHRFLTGEPHPAGSTRNRELADYVAQQFRDAGMQDVRLTRHDVLLPRPIEISVEMTHPRSWRASMREPIPASDSDLSRHEPSIDPAYHAYSASGDVTAPVVYAGAGEEADYDWLASQGIDIRGAIVLVKQTVSYSYRGAKAWRAEKRGAAGILIYPDPAANGSASGLVYPDGPWGPDTRLERGGVIYDFLVPGDPLTPGWASTAGARRIGKKEAPSLPQIISAPLSAVDARPILEALAGPRVPPDWQSALPIEFRAGPGPARVRLRVQSDDEVRPVWTVTGVFEGTESPDRIVIAGNHRDAWVFGGADPSSGTAALLELARCLGVMRRSGWEPRRSIMLASWDAEEFALTSSTEWGEENQTWLRTDAVAYLNVDSAASGQKFVAAANPSLARLLAEVAQAVRDPAAGVPVAAVARERWTAERGGVADAGDIRFIDARPGGGSDYTVFLNFLGIPVADVAFDGPHGVYHSAYDTHAWVARFGDPGFRYHRALVQLWGLALLRLTDAESLPLDPVTTATAIEEFVAELGRRVPASMESDARVQRSMRGVGEAAKTLEAAARALEDRRTRALHAGDRQGLEQVNQRLLTFERAFLDPEGLPGRTWYRHLIHAPKFNYQPEVLPGLAAALEVHDAGQLVLAADRLSAALRRAALVLDAGVRSLTRTGSDPTSTGSLAPPR
ncbi:MAG: M28 family metallopeptidase [Vicinamibacterales bacterium]